VRVRLVWAQVSVLLGVGVSVAVGSVALWLMTVPMEAVQPFVPVTTTEYVPGALITAVPEAAFWLTTPGPLNA
jgi:membrane-bound metal-dependent hydrolase YbcI (DUF457 family)